MKNIAVNTLNYTGIVTISQYSGTKKVKIAQKHNTGGVSLFDFLADCLLGDFDTAYANRPTKVMLVERTTPRPDSTNYEYKAASGFVFLRIKPEKTVSGRRSSVRYSFLIPRDLIENLSNSANLGLGLYSNSASWDEPQNFIAFCDLDLDMSTLANASLVVDWELVITNTSSNESGTD